MAVSGSPAGQRRTYFHLQLAAQRIRELADSMFRQHAGITTAQAAALTLVADHGGCNQRLLAQTLQQRESAVTAIVRRLEHAGFLERRVSASDGRAWELWLTAAGVDALARLGPALTALNRVIECAVGTDDVDALTDALQRLSSQARDPVEPG